MKRIYICLEEPPQSRGYDLAQKWLEDAFPAYYPDAEPVIERKPLGSYSKEEEDDITLALFNRNALELVTHKAALSARIVPIMIGATVSWNVATNHSMVCIVTATTMGKGTCVCTPTLMEGQPVDSFGKVLKVTAEAEDRIRVIAGPTPEAERLTGFIVSVLQKDSSTIKH